jgi:spore coat polysaccharide biosynthesis protein SpsF
VIEYAIKHNADYCSNVLVESFPDGQDVEVFKFSALEKAWKEATLLSDREHVTPFIRKNSDFCGGEIFKAINFHSNLNYGSVRMTVDEMADFEVVKEVVEKLGLECSWKTYADYLLSAQNIAEKNKHINRNEGYEKSLKADKN